MNLNFPMLTPEQIEVKVKQVRDGNVALLLYKTARTDMDMLDKAVGPMNWESDYKEIKGNLYAGIGIRNDDGEMVWKWDCGTESRADGEGNEKKGEASDAFKRAGFKWGIGRELYTGPHIVAFVPTENYNGKLVLKEKHHKYDGFHVADIAYEDSKIVRLRIDDSHGKAVYSYPKNGSTRNADNSVQSAEEKQIEMKNARAAVTCERCGNIVKSVKLGNGSMFTSRQIIDQGQKDFGGCYCYRCQFELKANKEMATA